MSDRLECARAKYLSLLEVLRGVQIYLPVGPLGHHDGPDIPTEGQLVFGIVVHLVLPEHRRVPVALVKFKDCDCLNGGRLVVLQDQERKLMVIPYVLALRTTTSRLTVADMCIAVFSISLVAEINRCVASTLPAHHIVVHKIPGEIDDLFFTWGVCAVVVAIA